MKVNFDLSKATTQVTRKLPGLSRADAERSAKILVGYLAKDTETAEEKFFADMESALRRGEDWAVNTAMAALRAVADL